MGRKRGVGPEAEAEAEEEEEEEEEEAEKETKADQRMYFSPFSIYHLLIETTPSSGVLLGSSHDWEYVM